MMPKSSNRFSGDIMLQPFDERRIQTLDEIASRFRPKSSGSKQLPVRLKDKTKIQSAFGFGGLKALHSTNIISQVRAAAPDQSLAGNAAAIRRRRSYFFAAFQHLIFGLSA
jgi:hypothetical protein